MAPFARSLIIFGLVITVIGVLLLISPKIPGLGRLPGDISIQRDNFSFYLPLTSCLLASVVISILFWVFGRFRQ